MLRRAGLDYWKNVDVREYDSIEELYEKYPEGIYYYIENFGTGHYTDYDYSQIEEEQFFVFGRETSGIPKELIRGKEDHCLRIHMNDKIGRASCRESVQESQRARAAKRGLRY